MSEGPWIRFFPSDWLAGTRGMTAAETGIYITLIAMMYERGEPIPNDTSRLARLCGTTTAALKNTLSVLIDEGKISVVDGGLWNDRVGVETEIRRDKSTSAQKSAEMRWQKSQQKQRRTNANALPSQSGRNANQKPEARKDTTPSGVASAPPEIEERLREAAGWKDAISPGLFVVGPIIELIAAGVDLETDILPVVRAKAGRMTKPASSWAYFVEPIREAHSKRIEAGRGVSRPTPIKRDDEMTPEQLRDAWIKRLEYARPRDEWISWLWGPMPGQEGCRVPPDLLLPKDGKHFDGTPWNDRKPEAA